MKLKKLLILTLLALNAGFTKCHAGPKFEWQPTLWSGDSETQSIVRMENKQQVQMYTSDQRFDDMLCLHKSEPKKAVKAAFKIINQCEKWKEGTEMASMKATIAETLSVELTEVESEVEDAVQTQ